MKYRFFFICLVSTICLGQTAAQDTRNVPEVPYEWSNVPIVGGGFVDGIVFHPTDRNVRFCRTDMGGNENGRGNGERMMVDPINGNIIYMGTRMHGLWKSSDRGECWQRVYVGTHGRGIVTGVPK